MQCVVGGGKDGELLARNTRTVRARLREEWRLSAGATLKRGSERLKCGVGGGGLCKAEGSETLFLTEGMGRVRDFKIT